VGRHSLRTHWRALIAAPSVHSDELDRLAALARQLEAHRRLHEAREVWVQARLLLPPFSKQSDWIKHHIAELERAAEEAGIPEPENKWAQRLGPVGPVAILLAHTSSSKSP
jgi:hypothetical protein